jgi:hypothetical protein
MKWKNMRERSKRFLVRALRGSSRYMVIKWFLKLLNRVQGRTLPYLPSTVNTFLLSHWDRAKAPFYVWLPNLAESNGQSTNNVRTKYILSKGSPVSRLEMEKPRVVHETKIELEVSGVRGANSEASPHALFPFRPFPFRPFLISPLKW